MQLRWKVGVCLLSLFVGRGQYSHAAIEAEQVRQAIDHGVAFLKREQKADGSWQDHAGLPGAITSLVTLALLNSGVPPDDPQVQSALNYLRKIPPTMTYATALQTMVFAAAEPKTALPLLRRNALWFEQTQKRAGDRKGCWAYPQSDGDNSNSQFALLALHEAERAGVPVNMQTWRLALDYWQRTQNDDGSWGYTPGDTGTGSMTCAGIAACIITADKLNQGDAEVDGDRVRCCGTQQDNTAVERGLQWLGRNFSVHTNPGSRGAQAWLLYYLYGVERVGRLTNQRFLGKHDWYREGADLLVKSQDDLAGFWKGVGHAEDNEHIATSLSLLFLSKGRRPVLVAKLKHEPLDDWNHHRGDLANLTTFVESRWQRELTWQVIDSKNAQAEDLLQSPVLFISGQLEPEFSDEQVKRLRSYVDRGGFLFAESCCGGNDFDRGFRALMEKMFPEPEYKLHLLPPEHPAYSAEERVDPAHIKPLYGIDVGCRTSVIYSPENLSCYWEIARPGRDLKLPDAVQGQVDAARSVGINVLAYATNREVRFKLDVSQGTDESGERDPFDRAKVYIAKIRHGGGWNAAPGALGTLLRALKREAGLRVDTDARELALSEKKLFDYHLVFMHGRNAFRFSDAERKQLRTYLDRGGVLFADAVCASDEFSKSFRREIALIYPDRSLEPIPATHPLFTSEFGGFDLKTVQRRDPLRREAGAPLKAAIRDVEPELEGILLGDGYGVIFSPYDLSCALERHDSLECPGYTREDAARIGLNVMLYSLFQ